MKGFGLVFGLVLGVGAAVGGSFLLGQRGWLLPAPFASLMPGPLEGTWDGTSTFESTQDPRDPKYCSGGANLLARIGPGNHVTLTVSRFISPDYRTRCVPRTVTGDYTAVVSSDQDGSPQALSFTDSDGNVWQLKRTKPTWLEGAVTPSGSASATTFFADDVFITRHEGGADDPQVAPRTLVVAALGGFGFAVGLFIGAVLSGITAVGRRITGSGGKR